MLDSHIRIVEVEAYYQEERARTPLKFGAVVQDGITLCHVRVRAENRRGNVADGWGAIFLSDFWAYPTPAIPHEVKDAAMRRVVEEFCALLRGYAGYAHPIDIFMSLEGEIARLARTASAQLAEPMPLLAGLVCASPADAALHDAFGLANGISSYAGYGPDFVDHDLSAHLGPAFTGRYLADFVRPRLAEDVPVFHLVGGLDWLRTSEVPDGAPRDGHPNSLDEWIVRDGLFCLKVKLRGTDLPWDLERTFEVYRIARETQARTGEDRLYLSADTNEQCDSPEYMIELLHRLREAEPRAYDSLLYIEQPTERDLRGHRFDMRALSALKPVILDESLVGFEEMDLALELGWSGMALKTCKCHTMALLVAARAAQAGIPYTVQDLTNPGLALLHSVGMAAHLNPLMGVEANSRQFYPATSDPEAAVHRSIVDIRGGAAPTASLNGPGLGFNTARIPRAIFAR
jgi:hypothetical protein